MKVDHQESILLEATIETPYIVSVNKLYEPIIQWKQFGGTKFGVFAGLRLSDDAVKLKSAIHSELTKLDEKLEYNLIDWNKPFIFTLIYVLSTCYASRDCGNMEKCVTDAIFDYYKLNDNKIAALHQYKLFNADKDGSEYIKFRLSQPNINFSSLKV